MTAESPQEGREGGGGAEGGEKFPYVSIRTGGSWRNVSQERSLGWAGLGWSPLGNRLVPDEMGEGAGETAWPFGRFESREAVTQPWKALSVGILSLRLNASSRKPSSILPG